MPATLTRPSKAALRRLEMNVAVARQQLRYAHAHRMTSDEIDRRSTVVLRAEADLRAARRA
jgi:hypothetical protein